MQKEMFSLHTHTIGFDGKNTIEEMVNAAQRIGYTSIGISNHFIVYPDIDKSVMYQMASRPKLGGKAYQSIYSATFAEVLDKFQRHYDEIEEVKSKTSFPIYKGMEVDFFQYKGWSDGFEKTIDILKPDYIIGSVHFSVQDDKILNMHDILHLDTTHQRMVIHNYWKNLQKAIQSGYFDFMAHIDLYKRHNLGIEECFRPDEEQTVACLAEHQVPAEINTGSFRKNKKYDVLYLLQLFAKYEISTLLSDDSHKIDDLSSFYDVALSCAEQTGVKNYCRPIKVQNKFKLEQYLRLQNER